MSYRGAIVLDTDVLICLLKADVVHWLPGISSHEFVISEHNVAEVTRDTKETEQLSVALAHGWMRLARLDDPADIEFMTSMLFAIDEGEAAAIALAKRLGARVATHDRAARRFVESKLGRKAVCLEDILVALVREAIADAAEVDARAGRLASLNDYRVAPGGFALHAKSVVYGLLE